MNNDDLIKDTSSDIPVTDNTRLKRLPNRGSFDRAAINAILDEGFVCHVGFTTGGRTFVIPTAYARDGSDLLIHGSSASRMLRALSAGVDVCVTVTLIDGLVLARSAFHHSMNYRSVVIFGTAEPVTVESEKFAALKALTEHLVPHRWNEIREPNARELKATAVLRLPIEEASAKIRTGDPVDDADDYRLDVWAGVIPLQLSAGAPEKDARLSDRTAVPDYVANYRR